MADLDHLNHLVMLCETPEEWPILDKLIAEVAKAVLPAKDLGRVDELLFCKAYLDAAQAILPAGAVWRAYTDRTVSVYGASPYNAAAQECFDGHSDHRPLALCAAYLRLLIAPLAKARADAARRELTKAGDA